MGAIAGGKTCSAAAFAAATSAASLSFSFAAALASSLAAALTSLVDFADSAVFLSSSLA